MSGRRSSKQVAEPVTLRDPEFAIVAGDGAIVERFGPRLEDALRASHGRPATSIVDERSGTALAIGPQGAAGLARWRRARGKPTIASTRGGKLDAAIDLLRAELAQGPVLVSTLAARAREAGIAAGTLAAARVALGVACYRVPGGRGPWAVCMPGDVPESTVTRAVLRPRSR